MYPSRSGPAHPCAAEADPAAVETFHPSASVENGRRRSAKDHTVPEDRASWPRCSASRTSRSTTRDADATARRAAHCAEALHTTTPNADHSARACEASSIICRRTVASSLLISISLLRKCLLGFVRHCLAPEGSFEIGTSHLCNLFYPPGVPLTLTPFALPRSDRGLPLCLPDKGRQRHRTAPAIRAPAPPTTAQFAADQNPGSCRLAAPAATP